MLDGFNVLCQCFLVLIGVLDVVHVVFGEFMSVLCVGGVFNSGCVDVVL